MGGDVRRLPRGSAARRRTPSATTSTTSTASPATTGSPPCSPPAASSCPGGDPTDPADAETVCGLGNRKNVLFGEVLARDGVEAYPGSVELLDALDARGTRMAIVSSSANAPDGARAPRACSTGSRPSSTAPSPSSAGSPASRRPDTYVYAADDARRRRTTARSSSRTPCPGVQAGAAGDFGLVVGVDRGAGADTLPPHGRRRRRRGPGRARRRGRGRGPMSGSTGAAHSLPARRPAGPARLPGRPVAADRADLRQRAPRPQRDAVRGRQRLPRHARQRRGGPGRASRTAPSSTASTRPSRSSTPRRRSASPGSARRWSTSPTPS